MDTFTDSGGELGLDVKSLDRALSVFFIKSRIFLNVKLVILVKIYKNTAYGRDYDI